MKNRRPRRMDPIHLRNRILWVGLIITPFLLLLLWDDVENLIENFQSKKTATQEPLYIEDVTSPTYNIQPFIKERGGGDSSPRIYPYSVVNGGVHSVQELRSAIERDPVVAKHYSNFKLDRASVVEAKADRTYHVSYRMGDEIFWTKKRLKVAKGERLITDGTNVTRTRCANVLSEAPQGKTSLNEPTPEALDTPTLPASDPAPFMPPVVIPGGPLGPGAPTPPPWAPTPFIPPGPGPDPDPGPRTDPNPVPVPEPTTLLLLGSGLAGLWGFRKKLKK